jgi:hypothetical protein
VHGAVLIFWRQLSDYGDSAYEVEQKKRNAAARGGSMLAQWSPGSMEALEWLDREHLRQRQQAD